MPVTDVVEAVAEWGARRPELEMYRDYYNGNHRLAFATPAFLKDYQTVLEEARENLMPGVVRAFTSKLSIKGWEGDKGRVQAMTEMFDGIGGVKVQNLLHREAFRSGSSYGLVWPDRYNELRVWPKMALQFHVKYDPSSPGELLWAAMIWRLWDGANAHARVNVYYPGVCERWISVKAVGTRSSVGDKNVIENYPSNAQGWEPYDGGRDREDVLATGWTEQVPVVPFEFDPDEFNQPGRSILKEAIPIQDALNKSIADMIVGGEAMVLPLRAIINYVGTKVIDPNTGLPKESGLKWDPTITKIMGLRPVPGGDKEQKLAQFDPPDASKILAMQNAYAMKICRIVGMPPFYFEVGQGEPPSGVSLRVLSTRMTDLSLDTQQDFTPSWSKIAELLGVEDVRPTWKDPAPVDMTEELEAAVVRKEIGYSLEANLREMGKDEDEIRDIVQADADAQARTLRAQEVAFRSLEQDRSAEDIGA